MVVVERIDAVHHLIADLKACGTLERAKQLHAEARKYSSTNVTNTLINVYSRCGSMKDARQIFDTTLKPTVVAWTALILGYASNGQAMTALEMFNKMRTEGPPPDSVAVLAALKACTCLASETRSCSPLKVRARAEEIYSFAVENGCGSTKVQNTMIDLYSKCGSMLHAQHIFDKMEPSDVVSWNVLIAGYVDNGKAFAALDMFMRMNIERVVPNSVTFVAALKACTGLAFNRSSENWKRGRKVHLLAMVNGCHSNSYVLSTLIDMYGKYAKMVEAHEVLKRMNHATVVSWNAMILGYAENGQGLMALKLFARMINEGPAADPVTLTGALKACISLTLEEKYDGWVKQGKLIHKIVVENGFDSDIKVQSTLIDMYAKCHRISDAVKVFEKMSNPNVVSWTVLILGYTENGQGETALKMYTKMRSQGHTPDCVTYSAVLKACTFLGALEIGQKIHSDIVSNDQLDMVLVTCLVDFYARCGCLSEARRVFELHVTTRGLNTWTALLSGFSSIGDNEAVFDLFEKMQNEGFKPDAVTLLTVLTCCAHAGLVEKGRQCFDEMPKKYGVAPTIGHYTCVVDIYGRAKKLDEAMALMVRMPCSPNYVTWIIILTACRKLKNVEIGKLAFQSLTNFADMDVAGFVLMSQIYGSRGMSQELELLMAMKNKFIADLGNPG